MATDRGTVDIVAHALWAAAGAEVLRRRSLVTKPQMGAIVVLAMVPDVAQMLPLLWWAAAGDGSSQALYSYAVASPGTEPCFHRRCRCSFITCIAPRTAPSLQPLPLS